MLYSRPMNALTKSEYCLHYAVQKPKESGESAALLAHYFEQACYEEAPETITKWVQDNVVGLQIIQRLLNEPHSEVIKDTIADAFEALPDRLY